MNSWENSIYSVDDQNATLHTAQNKGHEAAAYLTYIVNNYDSLRDVTVFLHPHRVGRGAWHNDAINHDNVISLHMLRLSHVLNNGYVNLRCRTDLGCPAEIQPFRKEQESDNEVESIMPEAWISLFGGDMPIPNEIGVACCAQFAVSKEQVLTRPKEDYERYHKWLMETSLDDAVSGRIFEYLWHVIFGREAKHCPDMKTCYCEVYGLCSKDGRDPLENPFEPHLDALPDTFKWHLE